MGDGWGSAAVVSLLLLAACANGDRLVTDGKQLADAVASLATGADSTLLLGSEYITMRNVTFSSAPFQGQLAIEPGPNVSQPVLDAAMRPGLTKPGSSGPGRIQLSGFTLVNLCDWPYPLKVPVFWSDPWAMALFSFSRAVQRLAYSDIILYGRHAALTTLVYKYLAGHVDPHFKRVVDLTGWTVASFPENDNTMRRVTTYAMTTGNFNLPAVMGYNVTLRSTADPYDPLMNVMKAAGTLMPPTLCNGTLLPAKLVQSEVDLVNGPLWLVSSRTEMADALTKAAALSQVQAEQDLPPAIHVCESLTLDTLVGPLAISRILWLAGPTKGNEIVEAVMGLTQRVGVLALAAGAQLYVQDLTLAGLATSPSSSASAAAATSQVPSAFPLRFVSIAAGPDTWASFPYLWLYNVTLLLPTNDYLALMSLVLGDSHSSLRSRILQDSTISALAGQLRSGISQLTAGAIAPSLQSFSLALFTGWGINATSLTLKPAMPLGADTLAECSSGSDSGANDTQLILACVLGTAIPLLLLLAGVVGWMVWRERKLQDSTAVHGKHATPPASQTSLSEPTHGAADVTNSFTALQAACMGQQVTTASVATPTWFTHQPGTGHTRSALQAPQADNAVAVASSLLLTVQCAELMHASQLGMSNLAGMQSRLVDGPQVAHAHGPGHALAVADMAAVLSSQTSLPSNQQPSANRPQLDWAGDEPLIRAAAQATDLEQTVSAGQKSKVVLVLDMPPSTAEATEADRSTHQRQLVQKMVAQLTQGSDADKVVIKGVLGKGASGIVYAGVWRGLPVALKTMVFYSQAEDDAASEPGPSSSGQGQDAAQRAKMHRSPSAIMEMAIAASVGHPNVVATYCYDCKPIGTHQDAATAGELQISEDFLPEAPVPGTEFKMYLVQELCGNSLESALAAFALRLAGTNLTDQVAVLAILLDIAQGLEYLHENGIMHGDLKPANVLLKVDSKATTGVVAKLADFGFSTYMGPTATHVSNYMSGTPFYAAPEVVHERRASTASDVFSFGVICWQLWTGCTPYISTGDGARFDPRFPGFFEPNIPPPAFKDLALQCLRQDPHERPTATMIIGALHKCLAGANA